MIFFLVILLNMIKLFRNCLCLSTSNMTFLNLYSLRPKLYVALGKKNCPKLFVVLQYQCNINVIFLIITLTIYYYFFFQFSFIFPILFIKDNFVKQLIISLFHTILIVFLNMYEMPKTSYNLGRREYLTMEERN